MDAHLTIDNQKGFMYQGRFSAILETEPLREKIAAHLKTDRGEKDEEAYDMPLHEKASDSRLRN